MDKTISFHAGDDQLSLLNRAAEQLGLPDADAAAENLVKQKLEQMARRVGKDGRGKAMYRPPMRHH